MIQYYFPFALPPKERERAKAIKVGNKWTATVYSPQSTKKFYTKFRTYLEHHYPNYGKDKIDYDMEVFLQIGTTLLNANNDLDNRIKSLDCFNRDNAKKCNSGFKGIWKDDKLIKKITAELVYVENQEDEFTLLQCMPYQVKFHGRD